MNEIKIKTVFPIIFLLLFITSVKAQEKIRFGFSGGINFTNLDAEVYDKKADLGFYVGGLAEIAISKKFSLQPEVLYVSHNTKIKEVYLIETLNFVPTEYDFPWQEYKFRNIEVPVLIKFYLSSHFSLEAGPSFNFLLKSKQDSYDMDYAKNFNLSALGGVAYRLTNGLFASARYFHGLGDLFDKKSYKSGKNYGFQVGIGYIF